MNSCSLGESKSKNFAYGDRNTIVEGDGLESKGVTCGIHNTIEGDWNSKSFTVGVYKTIGGGDDWKYKNKEGWDCSGGESLGLACEKKDRQNNNTLLSYGKINGFGGSRMSACYVLQCNNRVVIATDSRTTHGNSHMDGVRKSVWVEKYKIAFVFAGLNEIGDENIADYVKNTKIEFGPDPEDALRKLAADVTAKIPQNESVSVCCCFFEESPISWYAQIDGGGIHGLSKVDLLWGNNTDIVRRLYSVPSDGGLAIPNIKLFSEEQAASFLAHLIDVRMKYDELMQFQNTVGGNIQILVLEKGGAHREYILNRN